MVGSRPVNGEVFYYEVGDMSFEVKSFDGKIERWLKWEQAGMGRD